jgi:hypothetical protein
MKAATTPAEPHDDLNVVQVLLAIFESGDQKWELAWVRRNGPRFRVTDCASGNHCWFGSYAVAREIFQACCEEAGQISIRSHSSQNRGVS